MRAFAATLLLIAASLSPVWSVPARAQSVPEAQPLPFSGIWSLEQRTCDLPADEDEYRVTVDAMQYREYAGSCRIDEARDQGQDTYATFLTCGTEKRPEKRIIRVLLRDRANAVFSELFAKGRPSRGMVRCGPVTAEEAPVPAEFANLETDKVLNTTDPGSLVRIWTKDLKTCTGGGRKAAEACTRRLYLAKRLRGLGYCHFTKRRFESWRRCD